MVSSPASRSATSASHQIWILDADGMLRFTSRGEGMEEAVTELLQDMDKAP